MSALFKAFLLTALLLLMIGSTFAAGSNSLHVDTSQCLSASDAEGATLDENGNPILLPEEEEDEEEEEPDCE